jgi:hypothetical protein
MMKKVSTLEGMVDTVTFRRRDGNLTRLIDNAIQIIFRGDVCVVKDHHGLDYGVDADGARRVDKFLFDSILNRLRSEHSWDFDSVVFDRIKLEIYLKPTKP